MKKFLFLIIIGMLLSCLNTSRTTDDNSLINDTTYISINIQLSNYSRVDSIKLYRNHFNLSIYDTDIEDNQKYKKENTYSYVLNEDQLSKFNEYMNLKLTNSKSINDSLNEFEFIKRSSKTKSCIYFSSYKEGLFVRDYSEYMSIMANIFPNNESFNLNR